MADISDKLAKIPNAISQKVSNGTRRAAKRTTGDVLRSVRKHSLGLLSPEGKPGDRFDKLARPAAAGYVAGASVGHLYEQSAKFLFGRGLRTGDSPMHARRTFSQGSKLEDRAEFENMIKAGLPDERAARFGNSLNAIKQEGALGLLVKAAASHAGTWIGKAFYKDADKVETLQRKFVGGADVVNAGLRTLVMSVPTVAAVATGVAVGAGASALLAAASLAKAGLQLGVKTVGTMRTRRAESKKTSRAGATQRAPATAGTTLKAAPNTGVRPASAETTRSDASTGASRASRAAEGLETLAVMHRGFPTEGTAEQRRKAIEDLWTKQGHTMEHLDTLRELNPRHPQLPSLTRALLRQQELTLAQTDRLEKEEQGADSPHVD